MAGRPSVPARIDQLDHLTQRDGANPETPGVFLALTTSDPGDNATLADLPEVVVNGYVRQGFTATPPDYDVTGGTVLTTNATDIMFGPLEEDMTDPVTHAVLVDVAAGVGGTVRYIFDMPEPLLGLTAEPLVVRAGTLRLYA